MISALTTADDFNIDVTCNMIGPKEYTLPGETVIIKIVPNFPEIFPYTVNFGDGTVVVIHESTVSHAWSFAAEHTIIVSVTIGLVQISGQTTCTIEYYDEGFAPEKVFLSTIHNSNSFVSDIEFIGVDQYTSTCKMDYGDKSNVYDLTSSDEEYLFAKYIEHEYNLCGKYILSGMCTNNYGNAENVTSFIARKFETEYHYITEGESVPMPLFGDEQFLQNTYVTRNDGYKVISSMVDDNTVSVMFEELTLFENYIELWSDQCNVLDSRIISTQTTLEAPGISSTSFNGGWSHTANITITFPRGNNIFLRTDFGFDQREGYLFTESQSGDKESGNKEGDKESGDESESKDNGNTKSEKSTQSFLYIYETLSPISVTFEVFYDSLSYYPLTAYLYNDVSESNANSLVSVEVPIKTISLKTGNIIDKADPVTIDIDLNTGLQGPDKVTFEVDHNNGDVTTEQYRSPTYEFTPFVHKYTYTSWQNYEICVKAYNEISSVRSCVKIQVGQDIDYFEVLTSTPARVEVGGFATIDLVCQKGSDRTYTVDFDDGTVLEVRDLDIEKDLGIDPYEIEKESLEGDDSASSEADDVKVTTVSSEPDVSIEGTDAEANTTTAAPITKRRKKRAADFSTPESLQEATKQASLSSTTTPTIPTTTTAAPTTTTLTTTTLSTTTTKEPSLTAVDGNKAGGKPGDTNVKRISERVVRINHKYYNPGVYRVRAKVENTFSEFHAELCPNIAVADVNSSNCKSVILEFNHESSISQFYDHDRASELVLILLASDNCETSNFEYSWKAVELQEIDGDKMLQRPIYNKICRMLDTNNTIVVAPRYLDFGLYMITASASPTGKRLVVAEKIFYLRIVESPPMVKLSGELHDTFYIYGQAVADFAESRDPDKDEFDREGIEFDIFCLAEIQLKHAKKLPLGAWKSKSSVLGSGTVFESSTSNAVQFHDYLEASCFDDEVKDNVSRELMIKYDGAVYISGDLFSNSVTAFAFWLCGTKSGRTGCTFKDFVVKKDNSSSALDDLDANLNNTSPAQALRILTQVADIVTVSVSTNPVTLFCR